MKENDSGGKRMRKKLTVFALSAVLCLGVLTACGGSGGGGNAGVFGKFEGELEENVTIRILENDTAKEKGYLKELLDAFNAEYKKYGITAVDANIDEYSDLATNGPYGLGPDVIYQAHDKLMDYADNKHITPLPMDRFDLVDQIPESAWNAYKKTAEDGTIYTMGIPVNVETPMLFYRKDLLPSDWKTAYDANADDVPDMIQNWTDMYKFSGERRAMSAGSKQVYGYMASIYDVYFSSGFLFSYGAYIFGDNNTNPEKIGFSNGDSYKGAWVIRQLASQMNRGCVDDTIIKNRYAKLASGEYFASLSTPNTYSLFYSKLVAEYEKTMTKAEAEAKAKENLVMCEVPGSLPASGDLTDTAAASVQTKTMGGINGYAISSYTKSPKASLAFVEFATKFEMIKRRHELTGIAPARSDVAASVGGVSQLLFESLKDGKIVLMPSISAVSQVWKSGESFFADLAEDPFREAGKQKYLTDQSLKDGLKKVDKNIYDAIHSLG